MAYMTKKNIPVAVSSDFISNHNIFHHPLGAQSRIIMPYPQGCQATKVLMLKKLICKFNYNFFLRFTFNTPRLFFKFRLH
jgi:hypothetical protein